MTKIKSIFDLVLHAGINTYKKVGSSASLHKSYQATKNDNKHKKGAISVVRNKEDLSTPGGVKGYIITSKETLLEDFIELSHWSPNVYNYLLYTNQNKRHIKKHEETNLQQINTFVVDIDTKKQPYTEILTAALEHSIGIPTMLLETPKGFQAYFILERPLFISNHNDYRGLKVAKRISENIRGSLSEVLQGVDLSCNHFGFFRMPNQENVRWFSEEMVFSMESLIAWSKRQDDDQGRGLFVVGKKGQASDPTQSEWFQALLSTRHVKGNKGQIGRDNLMYTIALACYSAGKGKEETLDLLDEYNSSLVEPLRHSEVRKIAQSAFKGRFKGANQAYIQQLLEEWVSGKDVPVTNHLGGWYKFKKERKERVRSHYEEWEEDLLAYIQSEASTEHPIVWTTQTAACEAVGIPRSSFNEVIRKSKNILIKRKGKGCKAQTGLTSVAVLLQCALEYSRKHRASYYEAIQLMTTEKGNENALWELDNQLSLIEKHRIGSEKNGKYLNTS